MGDPLISKEEVFNIAKGIYKADDELAQKIYDKLALGFLSGMDLHKRVHYVYLMKKYTAEELARMEEAYVKSLE